MATITTAVHIKDVTYAANEGITVNGPFGVLTYDGQDANDVIKAEAYLPGTMTADSYGGVIEFVNASTSPLSMLIVALYEANGTGDFIIPIGVKGLIRARGNWVEIHTSNGAANQTIDFSATGGIKSSNGKTIDCPPVIFAEKTAGSGDYVPMFNIYGNRPKEGTGNWTAYQTFSHYGTTYLAGPVFEYDAVTQTLYLPTSTTNGWIPPNGAKIRIPNIHITCDGAPVSAAYIVKDNSFGSWDLEVCSISNKFSSLTYNNSVWDTRLKDVALGTPFFLGKGRNDTIIDGLYATWRGYSGEVGLRHSCLGVATAKNIHISGNANHGGFELGPLNVVTELGKVYVLEPEHSLNYTVTGIIDNVKGEPDSPLQVGPFHFIGASVALTGFENVHLNELITSGRPSGIPSSTGAVPSVRLGNHSQGAGRPPCKNFSIKNMTLAASAAPNSVHLIQVTQTCENIAISSVNYDGYNYVGGTRFSAGLITGTCGPRLWINDVNMGGGASPIGTQVEYTAPSQVKSCRLTGYTSMGGAAMSNALQQAQSGGFSNLSANNASFVTYTTNAANTQGNIGFLIGGVDGLYDTFTLNSASTIGVDYWQTYGGHLYFPGTGLDMTWTSVEPIYGITSAAGSTVTAVGSHGYDTPSWPATTAVQFRLRNGDESSWGSWYDLASANIATAFNALSGYDSDIGFHIQVNLTTSGALAGRYISMVVIKDLTFDPTWIADYTGTIEVGTSAAIDDCAVALIDVNTPASPIVRKYGTTAGGGKVFEYPYNFDGVATAIRVVERKAGYEGYEVEIATYQAGKILPATLALKEAAIADSGGITFVGDTSATLGASKTLQQLYSNSQHASCLEANMLYAIPVVSGGNGAYTANVNVVATGYTLNGAGSLAMGANTLTANDSFSYTYTGGTFSQATTVPTFSGGTLTLPTAITTSPGFTMSSGAIVFGATSALWDLSTCTIDSGVTLSNTSGAGITVAMPVGYPNTTIGSGVTEIIIDNTVTYTLTIEADSTLLGHAVYVYDSDNSPADSYGTLLGGTSSCTGATFSLAVDASNLVWVQIFKTGYVEYGQAFTMPAASSTLSVVLDPDENAA